MTKYSYWVLSLILLATSCSRPSEPKTVVEPILGRTEIKLPASDSSTEAEKKVEKVKVESSPGKIEPSALAGSAISALAPSETAAFSFPNDSAGRAVSEVIVPPAPVIPTERFSTDHRPRVVPNWVFEPYTIPNQIPTPPKAVLAAPIPLLPASTRESFTSTLLLLPLNQPRPILRPVKVEPKRSKSIDLPPPLPPLARQLPSRSSLEDPTAEVGDAAIIKSTAAPSLKPAEFENVSLPDPFELAEQIKPRVPASAEPSLAPVVVSPPRPKS